MSAAKPAALPDTAKPPRALRSPLPQRLLMLFFAGWLLFDFPLLRLLLAPGTWWGLPRGPVLIFAAWGLLIAVLAWWLEHDEQEG